MKIWYDIHLKYILIHFVLISNMIWTLIYNIIITAQFNTELEHLFYLIHKSRNTPVPYPTMLHSEQKCAHFCSEWSIVGYETGAFWDLWNWPIVLPMQQSHFTNGLLPLDKQVIAYMTVYFKRVFPCLWLQYYCLPGSLLKWMVHELLVTMFVPYMTVIVLTHCGLVKPHQVRSWLKGWPDNSPKLLWILGGTTQYLHLTTREWVLARFTNTLNEQACMFRSS